MNPILVALDSSPRARGVLDAAIALARQTKRGLVLFRAVGIPIELPPEALVVSPSALPGILESHARTDLDARTRGLPADVHGTVLVKLGTPWEVICQAAREVDAWMIVLGSHGYSGIDRLIGTTASRVVNHADRSVLVVREAPK
jgi:nucleotide-binding universal stress UspA family protein